MLEGFSLRPASEQDLPFLLELRASTMDAHHASSGIHQTPEDALARVHAFLDVAQVVEIQGRPIGMIKVTREPRGLRIVQLQLLPEHQGRGIGGALVGRVLERARAQGHPVLLSVLHANPAQRLYRRLGFSVVGQDEHSLHMEWRDAARADRGLSIRHATEADVEPLAAFAARAFRDTYRELDAPEDIEDHVQTHLRPEVLRAVVTDPLNTTLLAHREGTLAGYAVLARSAPPAGVTGAQPLEIARFYLGQGFHGQGLGKALMHACHRQARDLGAQTLWLAVYDRNLRAVRFYERFGFAKVGGQEFLFGGRVYIDPVYAMPVRVED